MGDRARERVLVVVGTRGTGLLIARCLLQRSCTVRFLARDPARGRGPRVADWNTLYSGLKPDA